MIRKIIFISVFSILFSGVLSAANGFREFQFGDSYKEVMDSGKELCKFGELEKHTRWNWKSELDCKGYLFKENTRTRLIFQFSDDELVKIFVVSKDIKDYFLIRNPEYNYLLPLKPSTLNPTSTNLADKLLFKDKVHYLGDEYRYTTFFHKGEWEWEYLYEKKGNQRDDIRRKEKQLEEEMEGGVIGWSKFKFDEPESEIKMKLEGMCSSISVLSGGGVDQLLQCNDYVFLDKKIAVLFFFKESGLMKIELKLTGEWYDLLLESLKRKYGFPYLELDKNDYYYRSIEFPKANVILAYKSGENGNDSVWLSLKYVKEGCEDEDQVQIQMRQKGKTKPEELKKTKTERVLDSI
ncbi:hypothetical protein KJ966_30260 [bacterium]|nr:hypothetical protein [bacterium]